MATSTNTDSLGDQPGNGPGEEPVGGTGVAGVATVLVLLTGVLLYQTVQRWPGCELAASATTSPARGNEPSAASSTPAPPASGMAILGLEPRTGPAGVDTVVTLRGRGLSGTPRVLVEGVEAADAKLVGTDVTARIPVRRPGVASVVLEMRGATAGAPPTVLSAGTFTYIGALKIADVTPTAVSPRGGAVVALTGSGFGPGMSVAIGGSPATDVVVNDETSSTARVPAGASGPVDVSVRLGPATATLAGKLTYRCPAPDGSALLILVLLAGALGGVLHALRSLYTYVGSRKLVWSWVLMYLLLPLVGATMALLFYLIVGAGLLPLAGTEPGFGVIGVGALVGLFSGEALEKLKRVAEGVFTQVPKSTDALATAKMSIDKIVPATGVPAGATAVRITGAGFGADATVTFGKLPAAQVTAVDEKTLDVITPALALPMGAAFHDVDVTVSRPGRTTAVKTNGFRYQ